MINKQTRVFKGMPDLNPEIILWAVPDMCKVCGNPLSNHAKKAAKSLWEVDMLVCLPPPEDDPPVVLTAEERKKEQDDYMRYIGECFIRDVVSLPFILWKWKVKNE